MTKEYIKELKEEIRVLEAELMSAKTRGDRRYVRLLEWKIEARRQRLKPKPACGLDEVRRIV